MLLDGSGCVRTGHFKKTTASAGRGEQPLLVSKDGSTECVLSFVSGLTSLF